MMDINKILGKRVINPMKNFGLKSFGGKNDLDFDGVPNRKDCQPRNTMRQDSIPKIILDILSDKKEHSHLELVNAVEQGYTSRTGYGTQYARLRTDEALYKLVNYKKIVIRPRRGFYKLK